MSGNFLRLIAGAAMLSSAPIVAAEEVTLSVPAGDHVLGATLTLPDGAGPFPGAVLISGSGPSDRDESLPGVALRPFAKLASDLAAAGIATLRYDDRGVGASSGNFHAANAFDFAEDANAVHAALAARSEIDPLQVGLIGHSEGGMIAPIVAARNDQVAFVVTLAGTAVTGYEVFKDQLRAAFASLPDAEREAAISAQLHSLDLVVAQDWRSIEEMLNAEPGSTAEHVEQGMVYYRGWLHTFVTHDPAVDWRLVNVPVLAMYGERDVQVNPQLNATALELGLSGNARSTVRIVPRANHLFQDAITGALDEYASLPADFATGFSATIADWINAQK